MGEIRDTTTRYVNITIQEFKSNPFNPFLSICPFPAHWLQIIEIIAGKMHQLHIYSGYYIV
jgi:hypothetical protein